MTTSKRRLAVITNSGIEYDEIVGLRDVADRLGVKSQTAHSWRHRAKSPRPSNRTEYRDPFPEPDGAISNGQTPWWFWKATIVPWAKRTGRFST